MVCENIIELIDLYIDNETTQKETKFIKAYLKKHKEARIIYKNKLKRRELLKKSINYIEFDSKEINKNISKHIDTRIVKEVKYKQENHRLKIWSYSSSLVAIIAIILLFFTNVTFLSKIHYDSLTPEILLSSGNVLSNFTKNSEKITENKAEIRIISNKKTSLVTNSNLKYLSNDNLIYNPESYIVFDNNLVYVPTNTSNNTTNNDNESNNYSNYNKHNYIIKYRE